MKLATPLSLVFLLLGSCQLAAQQVPDTTYRYYPRQAAYAAGGGPLVLIDGAHNNLHRADGGFTAFNHLLRNDGYRVRGVDRSFAEKEVLDGAEILVIANALHASNVQNWVLPTPSAFTPEEIATLRAWVEKGGKLLLIADHMPYAGASAALGEAFGFGWLNGFARTRDRAWPPSVFSSANGGLVHNEVSDGRTEGERIDSVATFTGSAFTIPEGAIPLLRFAGDHVSLQPDTAWQFGPATPTQPLGDYFQGAVLRVGEGRVAVFGEAAMFTAQLANGNVRAGFNSPDAGQNAQFVLNLVHWLDDAPAYTGTKKTDPNQTTITEVLAANRAMEAAFAEKDYAGIGAFYLDDAVMLGYRHEVAGREAIDAYWQEMEGNGISWVLENVEIQPYAEVAVQRGISRLAYLYEGREVLSEVRFTLVWKKVDGAWKITIDHYSPI